MGLFLIYLFIFFYIQLVEHWYHWHSFVPGINKLCLRHLERVASPLVSVYEGNELVYIVQCVFFIQKAPYDSAKLQYACVYLHITSYNPKDLM